MSNIGPLFTNILIYCALNDIKLLWVKFSGHFMVLSASDSLIVNLKKF